MFVTSAISGMVGEGVIAAPLTGVMILVLLGSWRSTRIITVSIPLAILAGGQRVADPRARRRMDAARPARAEGAEHDGAATCGACSPESKVEAWPQT